MLYSLRDGVSYCQVDDHLIFLDLDNDRYFQLPVRLERAFLAQLHGDTPSGAEVEELVRQNLLMPQPKSEEPQRPQAILPPSRSAIERTFRPPSLDGRLLLEVFATMYSTQLQLKIRRLKHLVHALVDYRQRKTVGAPATPESSILEASDRFRCARLYVPIKTCCLLDSLAMLRFLSYRRLSAHLVFGVTSDPFAAHCWVQSGDWVLNDTVGNVIAHTPIREV